MVGRGKKERNGIELDCVLPEKASFRKTGTYLMRFEKKAGEQEKGPMTPQRK